MIRPKNLDLSSLLVGDIDLLVSPEMYLYFLKAVKDVCREDGLSFYLKRKKHSKVEMLVFDIKTKLTICFDLWFLLDVRFGRKKSYMSWEILSSNGCILKDEGGYFLEKDFSALFYISHLKSKNKNINNPEVIERVKFYLSLGLSEDVVFYFENLNEETYSKVFSYFLARKLFEPPFKIIKRKFIYETGSMLSFPAACVIGPDGVGKGTIIDLLITNTSSKYYRFKKTFRKSFFYMLQHSLLRSKNESKNVFDEKNRRNLFWFSLLRGYLIMFFHLGRKSLIFDRYFYDLMLDGLRSESIRIQKGDDFMSKLKWAPKLKTVIQLDAPAKVIRERKAELADDKVDALSNLYLECSAKSNPKEFLYLNTDQSLDNIKVFLEKLINERDFLKR